jgi:hypothetical protein
VVALVAGMGFAMSSTALALASLQERNLLSTAGGRAGFSVLRFQDLAGVPLLLTVGLLGGRSSLDWSSAGVAVALIVGLITGGRLLLRPALRVIAGTRLREVFVAAALLLVIGVAALMEAAGLSMALGAFLAGVMLAESEYREELEVDLEPFKGLLLGLFFIAIGMSVDLGLFLRAPHLVLGLAFGIVILKAAILFPIANLFGYCGRADAGLFAIALSQVGEFAFVLFAAAGPLLPSTTLSVLNAVVAASMLTTPLLFLLYEKTAARQLAREPDVADEGNPVIIAGFGRFGQVVSRVLNGLRVKATLIDHDPNQVELVRRFGNPTYYGDASRLDVLERAGIARAASRDGDRRRRARIAHRAPGAAPLSEPRDHRARARAHRRVRVPRPRGAGGARDLRLRARRRGARPALARARPARRAPRGHAVPAPRRGAHGADGGASRRGEAADRAQPAGPARPRAPANRGDLPARCRPR